MSIVVGLRCRTVAVLIAGCAASPSAHAAQPTEAELKALEQGLQQDAAAPPADPAAGSAVGPGPAGESTLNLSLILDTALAGWSTAEHLEQGGHDPNRSGFNLQQLELHFDSNVDPYFRIDANLVFNPEGEFELEEAYGSTLALPGHFTVRAGQFLTPFGRLNPTHPHAWSFVDQPIAIGKFLGPDGSRGPGAEVSWLAPLPWYAELFLASNQSAGPTFAKDLPVRDATDLLYTAALKQFFPFGDDWGLLFGLSTQQGPDTSGGKARASIYGGDVNLRWRPVDDPHRRSVTLQAEWILRKRSSVQGAVRDDGAYVYLVARLDPRWEIGVREEWLSGDPLDREAALLRRRHTAQATFYPTHFSRLRLQAQVDDAAWLPERIYGVMLALELIAGAHGAHAY